MSLKKTMILFKYTSSLQFLGRISMSLYLVHEPLIFYINLCVYGPYTGPVPPEPWRRTDIWQWLINYAINIHYCQR